MATLNYTKIKELFEQHGITKLYHVTDSSNWDNIKNNGLFSPEVQTMRSVYPTITLGDSVSHHIDTVKGLTPYIHLSFTKNSPCLQEALDSGRLDENYIILEFPIDILQGEDFLIYPESTGLIKSSSVKDIDELESLPWDAISADDYRMVSPEYRRFTQAEILVKNYIPASKIANYREIEKQVNEIEGRDTLERCCVVLLIEESLAMQRNVTIDGCQQKPIYQSVKEMANELIEWIVSKNLRLSKEEGSLLDRYDIAVVGYGDAVRNMWQEPYKNRELVNVNELSSTSYRNYISIEANSYDPNLVAGFEHVRKLLQNWIDKEGFNNMRPVIIHITEGSHLLHNTDLVRINLRQLSDIQTRRGNVEVWNILFSPHHSQPILLPGIKENHLLSPVGNLLSNFSSRLTEKSIEEANSQLHLRIHEAAEPKAMIVNSNFSKLAPIIIQ